ncbi:MAG: caspase family protein [Isosphaeraceae bacterium]|nr:caspase family protein [Isosphaeraceae bacterium]
MRGSRPTLSAVLLAGAALFLLIAVAAIVLLMPPAKREQPVDAGAAGIAKPDPLPAVEVKTAAEPKVAAPADTAKPPVAAPTDLAKPSGGRRDARPPDDGLQRVWSIVVGIDAYNDLSRIPAGRGGENSARTFAGWLKREAAWEDDGILLLVDRGERSPADPGEISPPLYPSRANLDWAFNKWLPARIRVGDVVVFYFAGQAVGLPPVPGSPVGAAGRGRLLAIDSAAASADITGFALEDAIDDVAKAGRNSIVCFLDTSLYGRGAPVETKLAQSPPDTSGYLHTLTRWPGVSAWIASDSRPARQPSGANELSPFTTVLLEAMGTRDEQYNLLAALSRLQRDPRSSGQGFRPSGNLAVDLTLWSSDLRRPAAKPPELLAQRGHARAVRRVAIASDGGRHLTGSDDSTVRIWRSDDATLTRVLDRNLHGVTGLALSDSGAFAASGDSQGGLHVWDFRRRAFVPPGELPKHTAGIIDLAFIPESNRLVSRDSKGVARLTGLSEFDESRSLISEQVAGLATASAFGPIAFVIVDSKGRMVRYGRDGLAKPGAVEEVGTRVDSARIATDGSRAVIADRSGKLTLWDESAGRVVLQEVVADRLDSVAVRGNRLAATSGSTLLLFDFAEGKLSKTASPALSDEATDLALSATGRYVVVRTRNSKIEGWALGDGGKAEALGLRGESGLATAFAISSDERTLVVGDQDGGVRFWDLASREPRAPVPARRGQIAALSVSGDGRRVLHVDFDHNAQLWDLDEARELTVLPPPETPGVVVPEGWLSGAITRDGSALVMTTYPSGDVVLLDRETVRPKRPEAAPAAAIAPFARPKDPDAPDESFAGEFDRVRIVEGPGRKLVAASAYKGDLVCIWDLLTGALLYTARCDDRVTSFDLSPDALRLLTTDEGGAIQIWDLANPNPAAPSEPRRLTRFVLAAEGNAATAALFLPPLSPEQPPRVVSGARNGEIAVWEEGRATPALVMIPNGPEVSCLALTEDRTRLAAGFRDKTLRHWRLAARPVQQPFLEPNPNHDEQINALVAWPGRPAIASASDDTTFRVWNLESRRLDGTFSAGEGSSDWIVHVPNGRFDCAVGAERRLTWLQNDEILPIEQFGERLRLPGLASAVGKGTPVDPPVVAIAERPRLAIDPPAGIKAENGEAELTIHLSGPDLQDLRVYQDGIPIRDSDDIQLVADRRAGRVKVKLHNGTNRFYAMAGRPGTIDGRSNVVELRFDEPDPPGELHVLALGVGDYDKENRKLEFAKTDAIDIAEFLHSKGVRASEGLTYVLRDDEVNEASVTEKLRMLRNRVRDRPQDTVAVFLAGHTDMVGNRFSLLLPEFAFSEVAGTLNPRGTFLEFSTIYRYVAFLGCQNRLMIVDACRSGEIFNDPRVQYVRREFDSDAHKGKTSYILAARKGEVAGESAVLGHGLLTYALLKGMGAPNLSEVSFTDVFERYPTADRDRNKVVTAEELRWYADLTVPKLSRETPLLVQRSGVSRPATPRPPGGETPSTKAPEPPSPSAIPLVTVP